jgi:two-component system sensor histidine kinase UhpB
MAGSVADQVGAAQSEVRELLARLAPRADERVSTARLTALLQSLVRAQRSLSVELRVEGPVATIDQAGEAQEDVGEQDDDRAVPQAGDARLNEDAQEVDRNALQAGDGRGAASARPADLPASLMLAVYRLSQEGLTNVVRHAQARCARLTVRIPGDGFVHWQLADDGVGLPDIAAAFERGSGLAGMRERVWAFGGHLEVQDAQPGLLLQATLRVEAQPPGLSIATP